MKGFRWLMHTKKAKQFEYTPRYFDPRKEALDDLVERVKAEEAGKIPTKHQIKFDRKHGLAQAESNSNIRIIAIVVILSIAAFLILR